METRDLFHCSSILADYAFDTTHSRDESFVQIETRCCRHDRSVLRLDNGNNAHPVRSFHSHRSGRVSAMVSCGNLDNLGGPSHLSHCLRARCLVRSSLWSPCRHNAQQLKEASPKRPNQCEIVVFRWGNSEANVKVLLAVDGLTTGRAMSAFVASYTWSSRTVFRLLHAIDSTTGPRSIDRDSTALERRKKAELLLDKVATAIYDSCPDARVEKKTTVGSARETILDMAEKWDADLVVVGSSTKRRRGLKEVIGSVSTAVAFQCRCSVLVVRRKPSLTTPLKQHKTSAKQKNAESRKRRTK